MFAPLLSISNYEPTMIVHARILRPSLIIFGDGDF